MLVEEVFNNGGIYMGLFNLGRINYIVGSL